MDVEPLESKMYMEDFSSPNKVLDVAADFILRYYPTPEEHFFKDFTIIERQVRLGPFFDQTGIPLSEKQNGIHESLFTVGSFHLVLDKALHMAKLEISSQDRWIEIHIHKDGLSAKTNSGQIIEVLSKGAINRNVPGWKLTWCFFDKLLLGFCYIHQSCPIGLKLTKSPGIICHIDAKGQVVKTQESKINRWTLETLVLLRSVNDSSINKSTLKYLFMQCIGHGSHENVIFIDYFENLPEEKCPWINSNWWKASSWVFQPSVKMNRCCFKEH